MKYEINIPPELANRKSISAKEFNELILKPKKNKNHAVRTELDGIWFASKKEANRYSELKLLEKAGEITHLTLQPKFELQPKFKKNGKTYRAITYIADFMYCNFASGGQVVIEDVKPSPQFQTKEYRIKKKLFKQRYPQLELREIY